MNRYLSPQFVYLILSFLVIILFLFYGVSQLLVFFKSGAEQSKVTIFPTENVSTFYNPKLTWYDLDENEGRKMEAATYEKVTRDYLASNYYQLKALETGNVDGLHDYFTSKPRQHLVDLTEQYQKNNKSFLGTTIEHNCKVNFYSEDGTMITIEDEVISYKQLEKEGYSKIVSYDTANYEVMLLLEDNFWRVRHKVKDGNDFTLRTNSEYGLNKKAYITNNQIFMNNKKFKIKGLNYYPQTHSWQEMWQYFDSIRINKDFELIRESGFNTIRVFVQYDQFNKASVNKIDLSKLRQLMDLAADQDLKVIVTLFDFFLDYEVKDWTLSDRHAEAVVSSIWKHPALFAWDIKNEPDLDYEIHGEYQVNEWLKFIIQRIRRYDLKNFITIGWSQPELINNLNEHLDFLSFHFYREPEDLNQFLNQNSFNKPLFIGEFGKHTYSSWWYPFSQSNEDQLLYYDQVFEVANKHELNYAIWTLYDFMKVPSNVAGKWPWQKNPQKSYGIIDLKGTKKKSYQLIKDNNTKSSINQ